MVTFRWTASSPEPLTTAACHVMTPPGTYNGQVPADPTHGTPWQVTLLDLAREETQCLSY